MRRVWPGLLPLLLVVGCEDGGPPQSGAAPQVHVGFPRGGIVDTIVVDTVDRLPLRAADLIAPDGTATAASSVQAEGSPRFANGQYVVNDPWQSALMGTAGKAVMATQHTSGGAALYGQEQLLATISSADIPLPDPIAYKRDWTRYRIRLTFGTAPDLDTRLMPAPQPPAE